MTFLLSAYLLERYGPRLTLEQTAEAIGLSYGTLRNRMSRGEPHPRTHVDGKTFCSVQDVVEYLEQSRISDAERQC